MSNIVLYDFCKNVDKINSETNKNDFVNNYKNYKQNFDDIDIVLDQPQSIDSNLDISDILNLLNDLDTKNINYLSVTEIKYFKDLLELLETKISNNNQNIITCS
jgi:hypothetical protein